MISTETEKIESLLVDQANAQIPYGTATCQRNGLDMRHSKNYTPISELKNGRFRKLFDRHQKTLIF